MKKIGRNEPCHCGSGKKYKKCCLATDEASRPKAAPPPNDREQAIFEELLTVFAPEEVIAATTEIEDEKLLEKRARWFESALKAGGSLSHVRFTSEIFDTFVPRAMFTVGPLEDELMDLMAEELVTVLLEQERLAGIEEDTLSLLEEELKSLARKSGVGREVRRGALMMLLMLQGPKIDDEAQTQWPLFQLFQVQLGELMDEYASEAEELTTALDDGTLEERICSGDVPEEVLSQNPLLRARLELHFAEVAERTEKLLEDGPPLGFLLPHELLWLMHESEPELEELMSTEPGANGEQSVVDRWLELMGELCPEGLLEDVEERLNDWIDDDEEDEARRKGAGLLRLVLVGAADAVLASAFRYPEQATFYRNNEELRLAAPLVAALPNHEDGPWRKKDAKQRAKATEKSQLRVRERTTSEIRGRRCAAAARREERGVARATRATSNEVRRGCSGGRNPEVIFSRALNLGLEDASLSGERKTPTGREEAAVSWLDPDALTAYRKFLESIGDESGAEDIGLMLEGSDGAVAR